jgi:hypothetical protein
MYVVAVVGDGVGADVGLGVGLGVGAWSQTSNSKM